VTHNASWRICVARASRRAARLETDTKSTMSLQELEKPYDTPAVDTTAQTYYINARKNFSYYRLLTRPDMIWNWWTLEIADALHSL